MNYKKFCRQFKLPALALAALALAAAPSFAQDLVALEATATMPDGNVVPMWGYFVEDGQACTDVPAWQVGPTLTADPTTGTLTVNVRNCLSVPVSVFIPGQLKATSPVTFVDPQGRSRVRSFDAETPAAIAGVGGLGTYTWTGVKEGTYLYHSGTHAQVQVQMGLYGALTVGNYGITSEATLVYSEIDPALHAAVADGTYGTPAGPTSTFDYKSRYFLINGAAYPDTTDIAVDTITDVLLRFVNAGLKTHVPTLEGGLYMSLIAEDGNLYPSEMLPIEQYGIELPAAKTIDAVVNVGTAGTYALYDRALGLTNWMETGGGMLTYIVATAAAGTPTAVADAYEVVEDTVGGLVVAAPGVLTNDLADGGGPIPGTYDASLVSGPSSGALECVTTTTPGLCADGSFTYTPEAGFSGTDLFTYQAVDTTTPGPPSNEVTVTITVTLVNDFAPVANDDPATTAPITPVTIDVVANDTDADGNLDPTSVTVTTPATNGTAVSNFDGTVTYTPNAGTTSDSFVYEVCDTGEGDGVTNVLCDTATVNIAVVNNAPVAIDDPATTSSGTQVTINVVGNDTDEDGNLDPTTANTDCTVGTPFCSLPNDGTLVNNSNGTFTYIPDPLFLGSDSFVYEVCDTGDDGLGLNALCDTATVTIEVTNSPPVANDDFETTTKNIAVAFNVTFNDVDADGNMDVATVDLDPGTAGQQIDVTTARGGTAMVDAFGEVTFTPKNGFRGTDLFQYTVEDTNGALSNVATVRINVLK